MKLLSAGLLTASMVSYTYANRCQSPLVNKADCMSYKKKNFEKADCDSKDAKKLALVTSSGRLCVGPRCLIRKKNKRGKIKIKMSKKTGRNGKYVTFDYNHADNQLTVTAPDEIKGTYPVFENGKIKFTGKAGDVKCTIETPTTAGPTAAPTTAAPTTEAPIKLAPNRIYKTVTMWENYNLEFDLTPHSFGDKTKWRSIIKVTDKGHDQANYWMDSHPAVSFLIGHEFNLNIKSSVCNEDGKKGTWHMGPEQLNITEGIKAGGTYHIKIQGQRHGTVGVLSVWIDDKKLGQWKTQLCNEEKQGDIYTAAPAFTNTSNHQRTTAADATLSNIVWEKLVLPPQPNIKQNNAFKEVTMYEGYKLEFEIKPMVNENLGKFKSVMRIGNAEDYTDAHPRIYIHNNWEFQIMSSTCENKLVYGKGTMNGIYKLQFPWTQWQEQYYKITILAYPQDGGMMEVLLDGEQKWKGPTKLCSTQKKGTIWMKDPTSWIPAAQVHVKNVTYQQYT